MEERDEGGGGGGNAMDTATATTTTTKTTTTTNLKEMEGVGGTLQDRPALYLKQITSGTIS